MHRREFISLLGGAAAVWPLLGRAQLPGLMRRVSVLMAQTDGDPGGLAEIAGLTNGLRELGWMEGRNLRVDYRWPEGDVERARTHAKEAVASKPDVLVARSTPAALALKAETRTVPIVFVALAEPVSSGLVEGLARPGGNITGFTNFDGTVGSKLLEFLREVSPELKRVAVLYNPNTAPFAQSYLRSAEAGAVALALELRASPVQSDAEIEIGLAAIAREPGGGVVVIPDTFTLQRRDLIVSLLNRYRLPAVYATRGWALAGGLMIYSVDTVDLMHRAAGYLDRILKGASPGDLPVQQPSRYELSINLKTARALSLSVPDKLLALADEVIE
jgi:putative ABC transport system substrate-binding protein